MKNYLLNLGLNDAFEMYIKFNEIINKGGEFYANQYGFILYSISENRIIVHYGTGKTGTSRYWKNYLCELRDYKGKEMIIEIRHKPFEKLVNTIKEEK